MLPLYSGSPCVVSDESIPFITPGHPSFSAAPVAPGELISAPDSEVEARPAPSLEVEARGAAPLLVAQGRSSPSLAYASSAPSVLLASPAHHSYEQTHVCRSADGVEAPACAPPTRVSEATRSCEGVVEPVSATPQCGVAAPVVSPRLRVILERAAVRPRPTVRSISEAVSMAEHALGVKTETIRRMAIRAAVAADTSLRRAGHEDHDPAGHASAAAEAERFVRMAWNGRSTAGERLQWRRL